MAANYIKMHALFNMACRCDAPPGYWATPRADFAVTAIRQLSLTPSRLRRCALRLPPGDRRQAHPRRAQLGAPRMPPNRRCRIGQASAPPYGQCMVDTPWLAAAGCV